jgi:phage terminase large subunit-like protein
MSLGLNSGADLASPHRLTFAPAPAGYFFDEFAADRAVAFFPRFLRHSIGRFAGQPFELEDWERQIVREAFGWKRPDGSRRYRAIYIEIPRKNGKTTFAAGIGLYLLFADGEPVAEVYSVANDRDQARICLAEGRRLIGRTPFLKERSMEGMDFITAPMSSRWRVLSSTSGNKDGLNASGVIFDEVHALKSRELADLMHTSTGSRVQPLEVYITTAGSDLKSYCWELHQRALRVVRGELEDPEFLGVIFAADPDDDIHDPATWAKANPSLGRALSIEYMASQARNAADWPAYENAFKRLHLNIWTEQDVRWIPMALWDKCNLAPVELEDLRGRPCWGGLDLSTREDLTALALAARRLDGQPGFDVWVRAWCPKDTIELRARRDHVPYPQWAREGLLVPTEGNAIDYDWMRREISGVGRPEGSAEESIAEIVDLRELGVDPWNASQLSSQLLQDGLPLVTVPQGLKTMSPLSKQFESLIRRGELNHGGNPLLRWAAQNVAIEIDAAENIKPSKVKSHQRIDPIVAAIMAAGRAALADQPVPGIYSDPEAFTEAFPDVKVA